MARFLPACDTIMLITKMNGNFRRSAPLLAATLLVVLVGHLLFMSSSLHEQRLPANPATDATEHLPANSDFSQVVRHDADQLAGHCLIQWVKGVQGTILAGNLAAGPASASTPAIQDLPEMQPTARALGPPSPSDRQALLQVFRL